MKVKHSGSFRTLPVRDRIKIVAAFPFYFTAAALLSVVMRIENVASDILERVSK